MMRQVALGYGADEEGGTAALLPAEGGGANNGAAATTDLAALGGLGGLGPHALASGSIYNGGRNRTSEINLAEGAYALVSFFFFFREKKHYRRKELTPSTSDTFFQNKKNPKLRAPHST